MQLVRDTQESGFCLFVFKRRKSLEVKWHTTLIPVFMRQRQAEIYDVFQASLGYTGYFRTARAIQ